MAKPRWLDEREARLWRTWLRLNQELPSVLEQQISRDGGLSGADYAVLVPLSESPEGMLRARELRREILWDRSRLSHHVEADGEARPRGPRGMRRGRTGRHGSHDRLRPERRSRARPPGTWPPHAATSSICCQTRRSTSSPRCSSGSSPTSNTAEAMRA